MHRFRRRFTYAFLVAGVAALFYWNPLAADPEIPAKYRPWYSLFSVPGIVPGIDVAGGAELLYTLDTAQTDGEIVKRRKLLKVLESAEQIQAEITDLAARIAQEKREPEAQITEIRRELEGLDAEKPEDEERIAKLKVRIASLEERIEEAVGGLEKLYGELKKAAGSEDALKDLRRKTRNAIDDLAASRSHDISETVDRIRERIDSAGTREASVRALGSRRIRIQLPLRLALSPEERTAKRERYKRWLRELEDPEIEQALRDELRIVEERIKAEKKRATGVADLNERKNFLQMRLDRVDLEKRRGLLLSDLKTVQEEIGLLEQRLARLDELLSDSRLTAREQEEHRKEREGTGKRRDELRAVRAPAQPITEEMLADFSQRLGRPITLDDLDRAATLREGSEKEEERQLAAEIRRAIEASREPGKRLADWVRTEEKRIFDQQVEQLTDVISRQGVLHFYIVQNKKNQDKLEEAQENFRAGKAPPPGFKLAVASAAYDLLRSRAIERASELHFEIHPGDKEAWEGDPERRAILERRFARAAASVISRYIVIKQGAGKSFYLLKDKPDLDGTVIQSASYSYGEEGYQVNMRMTGPGGQLVYRMTSENVEELMAIVLDGELWTAPNIKEPFGEHCRITGKFTLREVRSLATVLSAGSLSVRVKFESQSVVGPTLGHDSIAKGIRSIMIGGATVIALMALYYLAAGLIANLALMLNLLLILGAMSFINATLTLPGIAGMLLTLGMAVDANVLIFERIREEKARGRSLRLAVQTGYARAWVTIFDANITTLITAAILYYAGTGPVKGFAITVFVGITASLYTSVIVTRLIVDFLVARGWVKELRMFRLFAVPKIRFMRLRPLTYALSIVVVVVGLVVFALHGDKYGTDFTGGAYARVRFAAPAEPAAVRSVAGKIVRELEAENRKQRAELIAQGQDLSAEARAKAERQAAFILVDIGVPDVQAFDPEPDGRSRIFTVVFRARMPEGMPEIDPETDELNEPQSVDVRRFVEKLKEPRFTSGRPGELGKLDALDPVPQIIFVGPTVARELQATALKAIVVAMVAIFIYILVRFEFGIGMGLGALAALVHDVAIVLGALAIADMFGLVAGTKIDLNIVAAVLTIVGYSLNDTIVVFDRIRENRRANRRAPLQEIVDASVNQTLMRTILTSTTTLLAVTALFIWGGGILHGLAFALLVGFAVGTYSSVFVASTIYVEYENWLVRRKQKLLRSGGGGPSKRRGSTGGGRR